MAIIYEKEYNGQVIKINDTFSADPKETYTNQSRTEYNFSAEGVAQVYNTYWGDTRLYPMPNSWISRDGGNTISSAGSWVKALYFKVNINGMLCLFIAGNNTFNSLVFQDRSGSGCPGGWAEWSTVNHRDQRCTFSTNVPIFEDEQTALDYCNETDETTRQNMIIENAVNYVSTDFGEETKYFYISNQKGMADCVRNTATPTGSMAWQSMRFSATSYAMTAPVHIIDMVPESSWVEGELMYSGLWYGTIMSRLEAKGETLPDGQYMYGFEFLTNIYIMPDEEAADQALETGDFSEAVNYTEVSEGGSYNPPEFGDDEQETEFGGGADTSPFMQTYVLSRSALIQVAQAWYNTNPSTLADIITGLKMFGDLPQECLAGITMYPFDVNRILNTTEQQYIYFGTYQLSTNPTVLHKAVSLKSNAYLDCGTIFLAALQHSYKDFEPYTTLDVYLPYIGWQRMDISLLINKNVSVRYYVDIHTRACTACILANNVFVAQYSGNIGVGLPTCGADYQGYSNAMASTILGGASSVFSGAKGAQGAAMGAIGNIMSGAGLALSVAGGVGGVAMGVASAAANTAATLNKLDAMGAPADHPQIKGGFTSCLGTYLPQSVLWRYIIHDTVEPNNFNALCGRPSSASGNVGSFSGFLSCKSVNLNTNHMLDAEANEVYTLLKNGVYI